MKTLTASSFKAKCLGLLDEIAGSGEEILITKRGKPVARVSPVEEPPALRGSVTYRVSDEELIAPLEEPWDATRE